MRERNVVVRIYGMKYSWKGHKAGNRRKDRIKRSGQARLVFVKDISRNLSTMWRWTGGDGSHGKISVTCRTVTFIFVSVLFSSSRQTQCGKLRVVNLNMEKAETMIQVSWAVPVTKIRDWAVHEVQIGSASNGAIPQTQKLKSLSVDNPVLSKVLSYKSLE